MARCTQKKNKELEAQPKVKSSLTLIAKQVKIIIYLILINKKLYKLEK